MPVELLKVGRYFTEVISYCDICRRLMGRATMPDYLAEDLRDSKQVCINCKEKSNLEVKVSK